MPYGAEANLAQHEKTALTQNEQITQNGGSMKHPEYDSPFELVMSDITTQMAKNIDEMCWQAVQRVGVNVKKETLLLALEYDSARYREAFRRGEETGYTKRDEEIVRCKDCQHNDEDFPCERHTLGAHAVYDENWFCADGQMKEG